MDLPSSKRRLDRDTASMVVTDPQDLLPRIGRRPVSNDRPVPGDRPVSADGNDPELLDGSTIALAEPARIPRWKRCLDLTCIVLTLLFWSPIMILVALWIKIVSPGPIFYRQERIGYRGKRFLIIKFRTMRVNVETVSHERYLDQLIQANCPMTKLDLSGDTRIIRGGRVLRALGLDELPQLFNVLCGEMSLVGPRPCTPHEFQRYQPWQRERVNVPPGLTGYWQVNGKNRTTFVEMINMDILYARKMSLWLDLTIMLRTFPAVAAQFIETRRARVQNRA